MHFLKRTIFTLAAISMIDSPIYAESNKQTPVYQDFTTVAEQAIPAVVSIQVKSNLKSKKLSFGNSSFQDEFFQQFFNFQIPDHMPEDEVGQASGFIITADGNIITNSHVVKDANEIEVTLNNGKKYAAKLIGQDSSTDVALIKIEANDLPFLKFAETDKLKVGQWAIAIGSPMGLDATLTVGVISAKGRNNLDIARIEDFIQTDAAINRGNSGGPLLNMQAEVMGMNTAIVSNNGSGYMGIGFAVPSNIIKNDMEQILTNGSVARGFIGVVLQQVDANLAEGLGLKKVEGILIADVAKDSPAEKAGLKQGDVILKYNNIPVLNIASFRNSIALMNPGTKINLTILRKATDPFDLAFEVGSLPDNEKKSVKTPQENKLGIAVEELTPELAKTLGFIDQKGVVISTIKPNTAISMVGLKKGTLILSINQQAVTSVDQFNKELESIDYSKPILLLVKQGSLTRFISIKTN